MSSRSSRRFPAVDDRQQAPGWAQELDEGDSYDRADQQQGDERFGVTRDIQIEIHGVFPSFREVRRPTPMESLVASVT